MTLLTETIVEHHGGLRVEYVLWSPARWAWRCKVTIRGEQDGMQIIPVGIGLSGWSTGGALTPFKGRSREAALGRARVAAKSSAWLS